MVLHMESREDFLFSPDKNNKWPIIFSPNLGKPTVLKYKEKDVDADTSSFYTFSILFVGSDSLEVEEIKEYLTGKIWLIPLFRLNLETNRLNRGNPISLEIIELNISETLDISEPENLIKFYKNKEIEAPRSYLKKEEVFGKSTEFFIAKVKFQITNEIYKWFKRRTYIMFDILEKIEEDSLRICYHALVISRQYWNSINFVHITDLHIARRNDYFLGSIFTNIEKSHFLIKFIKRRGKSKKKYERNMIKRVQNPNNQLRKFIKWANDKVAENKLDFIIASGDLIDYVTLASGGHLSDAQFKDTNWLVFFKILLNHPMKWNSEYPPVHIFQDQEISFPIFTIPGNHDYRKHHYSLSSVNVHRLFGLKRLEAELYRGDSWILSLKSLIIDSKCLHPYYQFFNPYQNYTLKFGSHIFIFMNTGHDRFLKITDLLMKNPASIGYSNEQLQYLQKNIDELSCNDSQHGYQNGKELNFLISHSPIINPIVKNALIRKLLSFFHLSHKIGLNQYKESKLKKIGFKNTRTDGKLHYTFGTISHNWIETVEIINLHKMINLAGHTHNFLECRSNLLCDYARKTSYHDLEGMKIKCDFPMYFDDYSELFSPKYAMKLLPLYLQTPALGIGRLGPKKRGAFRVFELQDNVIKNYQVKYLSKIDYLNRMEVFDLVKHKFNEDFYVNHPYSNVLLEKIEMK